MAVSVSSPNDLAEGICPWLRSCFGRLRELVEDVRERPAQHGFDPSHLVPGPDEIA